MSRLRNHAVQHADDPYGELEVRYNPATEGELYDLRSVPGELHDLAGMVAFKHVLRRMKERLVACVRATRDGPAAETPGSAVPTTSPCRAASADQRRLPLGVSPVFTITQMP